MERYFFFSLIFFFFFFPSSFFPFFSLPIFKSWDGFSPWKSPLFTYHSFFFFPSFPPHLHFFPPPFLSYSNFFLPLSPCLPFYSFPIFLLSILVCFFSSPVHQSTFITILRSQINVINIYLQSMLGHIN